ncbi:MAG: WD40 repeat domain-containing protein [Planctomycetota bacterium]
MLLLALPHLLAATLLPPPSIAGADPPGAITCAALLDERTLLLGRTDGLIVPVDPRTGERIGRDPFARHTSAIAELAVDHTGEFVAAASAGGEVALWSVRVERAGGAIGYPGPFASPTAEITPTPKPWHEAVELEWTHDGSHLVTWSYDWLHGESPTTVQVWTREGELVWTGPRARQVDVHPTERRLAAVVEDAVLLGWPGKDLRTIELSGAYDSVEFSPDGASLAVGGRDFALWILDCASGDVAKTRRIVEADPMQLHGFVQRVRWSPDGQHIGVVVAKGLIPAILDAETLETIVAPGLLGGRMWYVFDVAWTPLGCLLTGSGEVRAYDPSTSKFTRLCEGAEWQELVTIDDSREFVLVAGGVARRFDLMGTEVRWKR